MVTRSPSYISFAPKATVSFLSFLKVNTCFHCALLFRVCSTFQAVQWWWTFWSRLTPGYRARLVMRFPMRHSERYWITRHRWVKTEPYKQCRKFWPCTSISEWTLGFLFVLVGHANIQIIPSHLFFLSVFPLWHSLDSEEVCPLRTVSKKCMNANWEKEQTFVSLSRAGKHLQGKEWRGGETRQISSCREGRASQNASRLMWGHLSGSSLVVTLRYQGHLSVWPLYQFKTTSSAKAMPTFCQNTCQNVILEHFYKNTV